MRIRRLLWCACVLIGCAAVPMAVAEQDLSAQQMAPPTGKALVYVYRSPLIGGGPTSMTLDGKERGQIASNTYLMWVLNPGQHEIIATPAKGPYGFTEKPGKLTLGVEVDKTYFVQQKLGAWKIKLRLVDEKKGRKAVSSRLVVKGLLPGSTGALPGLQQDTLRMLMVMDSVHDKDCKDRKVVNTETLESTLEQKEKKIAVERWTVDRCGKRVAYTIVFSPSPQGGTDFQIMSPTK